MQTERDFRAELDALDETPGTPDEIERPSRSAWSPSTPLAKEVVDSEIVDQIGIRKTIEDEEKRETARRESSPLWTEAKNLLVAGPGAYLLGKTLGRGEGGEGALGTIGKLSDDERLQWIADEKVSADRSLAFWDNVKKTYGDKIKGAVAPVLDYSAVARAALKQAGVLGDDETIGGQFGSWLDRKTNENIALAKRRRLLAEQMEAGTREAPKFGALRSSFDDIERGIANVVASGIKGVAYGIETGDLIRVNPAIDAHLVDVLKRTGVISGNPSEAQKRNIYRFGAWIENETKAQFPEDDARANEFRKALSEGVGSMIGFMGAGFTALAIGKGAGISTLASGLMGGLSQAGSMTDDALKKYLKDAGTEGRKLTPEEERKATQVWLMGLGIGATEAVPLANFFAGHSGRFVRGVLLQATEEGGQEWVQQVLENVVAQRYYDPERKWDDNAWDGLAIGGIIGAKMQAGQAGIDRLRGQKPEEPVKAPAKVDEPAAPPMSLPDVPVPDVLPMIDGEGDGKAPRVRTTRPVDPDLEKYRQQIQAVRPPVSTPETVPGEKPAETKIPTFNEILSVLPRDERGDPDMGALVDQLEQFGVRAWNGLNDDQRRQVYETLKPVVGVVQANPEAVVKTVDEAIGEVVKAVGQEDMRQAVVPADAPVFEKASFTDAERRAIVTSDPKADVQKLAVRQGVKVVGHVSVERSSDGRRLMIHPELDPIYQRQGIGSKVYDSFAKVAASEGRRLVPSDMLSEAALGAWRKRDSDAVKDYKPNKELSSLMGRTTLTKGGVVSKNLERGILEGIGRAFEAADIPPTDSQRQAFNTVLRSKAKRSEWAKAAGVSKTQLDVLVNEALADGRLKKTKAGGIARTGKKVEVKATPATGQASGQPQAETRVEPTLSTGQGTGQAPTMDRATERRLEAVKSDVARGYAQQLIDAGTDATKFSSIVSKLSKDKKAPVAVVHEVATVITGQKGKTKQDSLNRLALAMPSKVSAPAETAETPAAPEPAAPSPVAPAQAAIEAFLEKKVRIEDAGEKIGGARKDAWASRGLNLEDLVTMSNGEQAKYVTKDGVWPKPDYAAMVADGMPAEVAALVKLIRDGLAAKPKVDTPDGRRAYVTMMGHVRSEFEKVRSIEDISKARDRIVYDLVGWPRGTFERGTPEQSTTLFSVFKGRREALRPDGQMQRKARQMVADGFPGDVEPWTRRFTVRRWSRPDKPENYAVLNKQGRLQAEAPTEAEAKAKAKEIYEAELAKGGDEGILPERPHLDNVVRTGKDIRGGRDVDSSDFLKDFGFRGIEFGNWVAGDERQKVVNLAYDALHDMANVLGIPPRAVSLNGTLGLAFGARGSGKFLAHYEPAKLVINMTKLRGAGSLAHEWAHALDHYFGELGRTDAYQGEARGASGWYERAKSYSGQPLTRFDRTRGRFEEMRLANIRPEMSAAFDGVMDALFNRDRTQADVVRDRELALERAQGNAAIYEKRIKTFEASDAKSQERNAQYGTALRENLKATQERIEILRKALDQARGPEFQPSGKVDSSFFTNAKKLSGKQAEKGYWARPTEMFARSFESYVFDKIAESGGQSDYLAQGVEGDRYSGPEYKGNPYPDAIERDAIKAAFDRLFDTMESTPEGALYAIATPPRVVSENLARRAVLATLRSGKAFALNDSAKQAMRDAMAKMPDILPPGTRSGFATKVAPNPAGSAQPFRAWFELNDGSTVSLDGSLDNFVGNGAGFLPTRKGGLVIHFVYAPVTADSIPTLAGRRWHEAIHALYAAKMFDPATWSLLVGHAETLGVLDISVRSYLTSIGEEPNGATNASLRDTYTKVYSGRMSGAQLQDVLDQEAVAIMTELLVMGVDLPLPDNIRSILSDIETGVIQRQGDEVDSAEGPVLAALRAPDRAKEVVDRAARMLHYRVGLSLRGLIDPQMKTARRIAKEPFDLTQVVVKSRTTEEVPLRDVFTIQQMVSIAGVKDKIDRPTSDDGLPPSLFKFNGLYYVNDGNHRVVAARALGQRTIRAEVIELARKEDVAQDAGAEVSRSADAASKPLGSKANAEGAPLKTSEKRSLGSFLFALGAPPTDHFSPESQDRKTLAKHFGATRIEDIGPDDPHPGRVLAFHGTYSDVDRFDVTRVRDLGVHFGTAEQSGSRPTSGTEDGAIDDFARTIPAVLDLNKAVTLTDLGTWSPELLAQDLEAEVPELRGLSERLRAAIPRSDATTQARARRMNIIRDALTSAGIDGIRYRNNTEGEGWSYIVWEPGHVISATSGNMLFALGGVRAETADLDALSRAETMETAGEPREAIWDKTGWFRGVDGKWRFEIDDSQATVTRTPKMRFGWAQLSDGVDHPSLYEAYPGLAKTNAQIIVDDTMSDDQTIGYAGEIDKWYWLKPRNALSIAANKSDVKPSTLHEIQHLIQRAEGFARGGDPRAEAPTYDGELVADFIRLRNDLLVKVLGLNAEDVSSIPANVQMSQKLWLDGHDRKVIDVLVDIEDHIEGAARGTTYLRLAGEVEARAVAKRAAMTLEERRARPPWLDYEVSEDRQIINLKRGGISRISVDSASGQMLFALGSGISDTQIDAETGQSMRRDLDSLGFYSKALEAARGLKQEKGTPEQMLAQLKKAGVKDAEIQATGLDRLFKDGSTTALESDAITLSPKRLEWEDFTAVAKSITTAPRDVGPYDLVAWHSGGYVNYDLVKKGATSAYDANGNSISKGSFRVKAGQNGGVEVTNARIADEAMQKKGIGTRVYNIIQTDFGDIPLMPSPWNQLSPNAVAFWAKRDRKKLEWTRQQQVESYEGDRYPDRIIPQQQGDRTASPTRRALLKQITREDIIKHLEENRVELREARYATTPEMPALTTEGSSYYRNMNRRREAAQAAGLAGSPKWSNYSLDPSNPTYRETVIHLSPTYSNRYKAVQAGYLDIDDAAQFSDKPIPDFTSGHFPEANIIGHMMTSMTRHEGKPVYTIDQIQSDWGQKLRDGGVRDEAKIAELQKRIDDGRSNLAAMRAKALQDVLVRPVDPRSGFSKGFYDVQFKTGDEWYTLARRTPVSELELKADPTGRKLVDGPRGDLDSVLRQGKSTEATYGKLASAVDMWTAEHASAVSATPGHPLVNTTDQWTQTTLRRAIRQAVEAGAEYIAIPTGDTVLSYNPGDTNGMRGFYGYHPKLANGTAIEGIVPKNLRKLLGNIDKSSPAPARIDQLETPSGMKGEGFTLFPLTQQVKDSVLEYGQPMFAFSGMKAVTARLDELDKAKKMEADGHSRADIWFDTGWFKHDGRWFEEKDDRDFARVGVDGKLSQVASHPTMFKDYPELANIPVSTMAAGGPANASYTPKSQGGLGSLLDRVAGRTSARLKITREADKEVLLEEIQHAIDDIEGGFKNVDPKNPYGGPVTATSANYVNAPFEQLARAAVARMNMTPEERRARPPWLDFKVQKKQAGKAKATTQAVPAASAPWFQRDDGVEVLPERLHLEDVLKEIVPSFAGKTPRDARILAAFIDGMKGPAFTPDTARVHQMVMDLAQSLAAKDPSGPYAKYIPAVEAYHAKAQLIGHNQGPPTTEWDSPFIYSLADDGAAPSLNQVIQSLKDTVGVVPTQTMLGVTIKAGDQEFRLNPRGNVAGQTQMATGAVGVRKSRHLEAIAHETAHYLETTLGAEVLDLQRDHQADLMAFYDARPDQPYSAPEAFAEFFRTYITNPSGAQAAAPDLVNAFEDVLEANGMLDGIHETQTLYQDWLARATPEELASDVVSIHAGNSWTELKADRAFENVPGKMATAYTNTIDDLNPLNKIVRKLLETADRNGVVDEEGRPISIKVAENPYKIARMFRGSYGTGYSWLTKGIAKRGETSVAFAPLSRALETLFGSANKKDWDQAMYQTAGQYLISKRALAEYDRLESKEARLGEINDLLGEGQEAWRQLSLENQQAGTTLERRESALIRQQALMRDRRNALRVSETALARLQERIQDKKDDVTAAQMARDEALTARRRRDLSILERDSQIALRQTQGLIEQYEGLSTDVAMLSAEIDQLRQRRDGLDGQLSGVSEAIEGLRREREATQKRGASRAPTKEPKEWHQDFIAKTEADPKYARIKDFASLVYEFSQGMLTLKHQHGLISDDLYAELSKRKDWYVPFQRDMSDANPEDVFFRGAGIEKWSPVKKFDGSDRAIINPLETMAGDAYTLAQQIAFNSATDALAKLAERAGPGSASIAQVLTREESAEANAATFDRIKNIAMSMGIDEADALRIVTQLEQNFAGSELSLLWSPATKGPVNLPTVPLYRNGERILVRFTDPEFGMQAYNAFSGMGKETAGLISEILGYPARLLQQGVTTHPTFIPRNLFRDIFDAWIKTGALPIVTQVKGVQAMRNDQFMRGYLEAGGITGGRNLAALTSKEKQVEILDLADKSISKGDVTLGSIAGGLLGAAFGGPLAIVPAAAAGAYIFNRFGALEAVESVETMTRLGVAAYAYDRAKKHNPDLTDTEAMLEAAFVSRDVFDWNRRGSRMIAIVRTITFLNAQIQGLDAAYRKLGGENDRGMVIAKHMNMVWRNENGGALSADERRALGDAYKTMGRMALYTGMLLALYAVATSGGDDDDRDKAYQDIKDKTKSTHSWLPQVFGTDLRLPKAFEWALPANTIEAIADKIRGRDPRAWDRIVDSVYEIAVPPTVPQGLNLIMGLTANVQIDQMAPWVKRLLGREVENNQPRQIVGDALKRLDPEAQFDAWSSQLSIDIAKSMSAIGIPRDMVPSPKKIDFILRTGGYWGQDIQKGYQVVKEALGGRQREEPRINDYPVIGGFTGVAARQSRSRDEMYQLMSQSGGQLKTAAETYKNLLIEQGVPADAERYLARLDPEERIYAILAFHGSPNDKRVHPLERLVMVDNVVNKIRKDVILDRLAPLEKQGRRNVRNFEEKIELNPRRQRQVHEIMERLQQAEAWNSMILMDRPGWQGKKEIKVDPILAELRAASPEVADIYADRLAKTKALSWDDVKSGWPDLRERIAREGVGAF